MQIYCLKCKEYTANKNANVSHTSSRRTFISAHCTVRNTNKIGSLKSKRKIPCQ